MALITTGQFIQDLRPGIRMWFGMAYPNFETLYDKMFDIKEADERAYVEDVMAAGLGLAQVKPEGSPVSYDFGKQEWSVRYTHLVYALGFQLSQEAIEDGVALQKAQMFTENLKLSMLKTRELICANVFNNGFNSSYTMADVNGGSGGDGVQLYSSAHPTANGNQSNVPTSPADLSEAALEQGVIDITGFTDERGLRIMAIPQKIIVPNALQFTIERILKSSLRVATADNDINAILEKGLFPQGYLMNPYLTSASAYFIKTDIPGLNFFERDPMEITEDNDFDTTNAKYKGRMRFSQGWTDWRSTYGINGP